VRQCWPGLSIQGLILGAQITAYVTGVVYRFKANFVNTGAATLNINGIGAKTIKKEAGAVDLEYGDIASGQVCEVTYDGTNLQLITLSGQKNPRGFAAVAGEDTDGTTTPQAVFISDGTNGLTAGRYYKGDANNYTDGRKRFDGFVKSNIATAASDFIITEGVVDGFSGLTEGEYYYLSTTAGGVTLTDTGIFSINNLSGRHHFHRQTFISPAAVALVCICSRVISI